MLECNFVFACHHWESDFTVLDLCRKALEELTKDAKGQVELLSLDGCLISRISQYDGLSLDDMYLSIRKDLLKWHKSWRKLGTKDALADIRRRVMIFMLHLCGRLDPSFRHDDSNDLSNDLRSVKEIWRFVKGIMMQFGFMMEDVTYQSMNFDVDADNAASSRVKFHLHLEVIVVGFICAHLIQRHFPRDVLMHHSIGGSNDLWTDVSSYTTFNIFCQAINQFSAQGETVNWMTLLSRSPFSCECISNALWITQAVHCVEDNGLSLLDSVRKAVDISKNLSSAADQDARSDVLIASPLPHIKDINGFTLWILFHLCPSIPRTGPFINGEPLDKAIATRVFHPVTNELENEWNEPKARFLLACVHRFREHGRLQGATSCQNDSLIMLLDVFVKHINQSFSLDPKSILSAQVLFKDSCSWADKWTNLEFLAPSSFRTEPSYTLYLHMLDEALSENEDLWKRMKGRLLSKFHGRFLGTLTESGWKRLFDLMLVLARRTHADKGIFSRFCDSIVENAWSSKGAVGRNVVVWRGLISLALVCQRWELESDVIVQRLATEFDGMVRHLKSLPQSSFLSQFWPLILVYCEAIESLCSSAASSLVSLATLISKSFAELLQLTLDDMKQEKLHTVLERLLDWYTRNFPCSTELLQSDQAHNHQTFLGALFSNILPIIKKLATAKNRPHIASIPYIAATLTTLALYYVYPDGRNLNCSAVGMFDFFVFCDDVSPQIVSAYLVTQVNGQSIIQAMLERLESGRQSRIVHTWIRCVIEMGEEEPQVNQLSINVCMAVPEISCLGLADEGSDMLLSKFIQNCGNRLDSDSFEESSLWQRRCHIYFAGIARYLGGALRQATVQSRLEDLIRIVGLIFKHCSKCLYVRGRTTNPLRDLASLILLPPDISLFLPALRQYFSMYLYGLCKLDMQNDAEIKDMLSGIVRTYLIKFHTGGPMDQHPLLTAIQQALPIGTRIGNFVIRVICQSFITTVALPQSTSIAVTFLLKLVPLVPPDDFMDAIEVVFDQCVGVYLKGSSEQLKAACLTLLRMSLDNCSRKMPSESTRNMLAGSLREKCLAGRNTQPGTLFALLDLIAQKCPDVLRDVLPYLSQMFIDKGNNYPAYQTTRARQSYVALLTKLGPLGQNELERIPKV